MAESGEEDEDEVLDEDELGESAGSLAIRQSIKIGESGKDGEGNEAEELGCTAATVLATVIPSDNVVQQHA